MAGRRCFAARAMICFRFTLTTGLASTIRPPPGLACASSTRSISAVLCTACADTCMPSDGAAASMGRRYPGHMGLAGSYMKATRVTRGAISLSNSSHFTLMVCSYVEKPVTLPPGRAMLEPRDKFPPSDHWITSSAVANSDSGTVMPSALAVPRLMTNSNLVDCMTGRSAGLSPLRMRPV